MTIDDRFWSKVRYDPGTECWLWTGSLTKSGSYPQFSMDGAPIRVHRLILELALDRPLGDGLCALHSCDVSACLSPEHLFEGTRKQNTDDMISKGRGRWPGAKKVNPGDGRRKLTDQQVAEIRALRGVVARAELGRRYGVTANYIHMILTGLRR